MTMRMAIGGIFHETNTYADESTGMTGLDRFEILRGDEIVERHKGNRSQIGGMLAAAERLGIEVVPVLDATIMPSGTIVREAYDTVKAELLAGLAAVLPLDAVALTVHGAGIVDGVDDMESDLARAVREVVGPDVKLLAALDLHGNITPAMGEVYDLMLGFHLYPHTDMYERGEEVVDLLPALLQGDITPVTHVEQLPILLPPSTTDPGNPAALMNEVCFEIERRPGVVDCTVFHGFPFTDVPEVGLSVVCITDDDPELARRCAAEVGEWIWSHREEFHPETHLPDTAVRVALEMEGGPVVINDTADNSGGGAPGDGTHLLRAFLDADLGGAKAVFGSIYDPAVAEAAHSAGVGATIDVELGAKHDSMHGDPVRISAYVKCLSDGKITLTSRLGQGLTFDMGKCAQLVVGDLSIVVASNSIQTLDETIFVLNGVDVRQYKVVGLKSSQHFREGFRDLAAAIVTADSPGLTALRTEFFEHKRAPRALWPTDATAQYEPTV